MHQQLEVLLLVVLQAMELVAQRNFPQQWELLPRLRVMMERDQVRNSYLPVVRLDLKLQTGSLMELVVRLKRRSSLLLAEED